MTTTTEAAAAAAARAAALARIAEAARQRAEAARRQAEAARAAREAAAAKAEKPVEKKAKTEANRFPKVTNSDFEVTETRGKRLAGAKAARSGERSELTQEEVVAYTAAVKALRQTRGYSEAEAHRAVGDDPRVAGLIVDGSRELEDGADIDEISATMTAGLKADKTLGLPKDLINEKTGEPLTEADGAGGVGKGERAGRSHKAGPVDVSKLSQGEKFDYYADVIRQSGGKLRTSPNDRNVLSFRNENSTRINGGQGTYNDVTVMLWKDSAGHKHVQEFWSNTEPVTYYEGRYGVDANHDGRLDLGRIPTGYYEYRKGYSSHLGNVLRPTRDFKVERDVNHDGVFNKGDRGLKTYGGGSMLFHSGGSTFVGSAGCQTMPPEVFSRFWNNLGSGTVGYTLVEGKPGQNAALVAKTNETAEAKFAKNGLSLGQLKKIMPDLPPEKAEAYLPFLNKAMDEAKIDTPKRAAAFLAQLAHESAQLKYFEEIASGAAYEGRSDLGNTHPGDGVRYKGRGPIQLTGRANYAAASKALGIDLVAHPERAADPDVGFRVAAWFWKTHGLNELADKGDFTEITHRINGGYNGLEERRAYYRRALEVLGGGLAGGPIATGGISNPGSSSSYYGPSGYDAPGGRSPSSGYSEGVSTKPSWDSPNASGPERNISDDYGGTSEFDQIASHAARSVGVDFDVMAFVLEFLMELLSDYSLFEDPEFKDWIKKQPGMKNWKPGMKIPRKLKAQFLAHKLEKLMKGKKGDVNALKDAAAKILDDAKKLSQPTPEQPEAPQPVTPVDPAAAAAVTPPLKPNEPADELS